jgi:hypothetical protein
MSKEETQGKVNTIISEIEGFMLEFPPQYETKPKMKRRIADWIVRFIENNHTHDWISVSSIELKQQCRVCGLISRTT